ncbi:GNAT family N-acetyltransferase [Streptomyces smyrnaeus]|uniref:GNAT family N-acetyltransferase n=1 Tax=Streptomyces smyrnaeus TaxID=1387713 RepID=A0ABS3Y4X7_9ACTN|nr:GNAT family protein [Streptomyces smyrnaeus]MBO8202713.1 GNAT family N-acetyltransferase [Streptomyces smyrnaeus]
MDENVRCRPLTEGDLHLLDRLAGDPALLGPYAWTGFRGGLRGRWADTGLLTDDLTVLAVVDQRDEAVGLATWRKAAYNNISHAWNLGLCVLPEKRLRSGGVQAFRWLIDYLFAHTQVNRLEAHIDVDNSPVRVGIEKFGFVCEGVARGAAFRDGVWRDVCLYGLLRADWFVASATPGPGSEPPAV